MSSYDALLQVPKDWFLFVIVVVVVAVDLLVILIGTAIPSSRLRATRIEDLQHPVSTVSSLNLCASIVGENWES